MMEDYYAILQVDRDASQKEIERAYRTRLRQFESADFTDHLSPDQLEEEIRSIRRAYAVLSKPEERLAYHAQLSQRRLTDAMSSDSPDILRYIEDQSTIYNERAIEFFQQKRLSDAITEWRRAIEVTPDVAELHHNLGNAYARQGALREAIDSWQKAVEIAPNLAEAHNNLGYAYYKLDNMAEARRCWEEAIRVDPGCRQAQRNLQLLERHQARIGSMPQPGEEILEEDMTAHPADTPQPGLQQTWWKRMWHKLNRRRIP